MIFRAIRLRTKRVRTKRIYCLKSDELNTHVIIARITPLMLSISECPLVHLKGEAHGLPNPHFFLANLFLLVHTKRTKKNA